MKKNHYLNDFLLLFNAVFSIFHMEPILTPRYSEGVSKITT